MLWVGIVDSCWAGNARAALSAYDYVLAHPSVPDLEAAD